MLARGGASRAWLLGGLKRGENRFRSLGLGLGFRVWGFFWGLKGSVGFRSSGFSVGCWVLLGVANGVNRVQDLLGRRVWPGDSGVKGPSLRADLFSPARADKRDSGLPSEFRTSEWPRLSGHCTSKPKPGYGGPL